MYLKTDKIISTIGDITMRSYRLGGTKEYVLDPTAIVGWDDGTNVRRDNTARMNRNGDFYEPAHHSARVVSLSGTALATNRSLLQEMRDDLLGLLVEGDYKTLWVETTASKRSALVGMEGTPSWVQQTDTTAVWRMTFYSPDPFMYGVERTINVGSTTAVVGGMSYPLKYPLNYNSQTSTLVLAGVSNSGNAPAWPILKVTGDYFSGFSITDGRDRKITYTGSVSYASPVIIDTLKGTATQNGVDKSVLLSDRQWFSVSPKGSIYPKFQPVQGSSGWCDIIIRDTYI